MSDFNRHLGFSPKGRLAASGCAVGRPEWGSAKASRIGGHRKGHSSRYPIGKAAWNLERADRRTSAVQTSQEIHQVEALFLSGKPSHSQKSKSGRERRQQVLPVRQEGSTIWLDREIEVQTVRPHLSGRDMPISASAHSGDFGASGWNDCFLS